MGKYKESIVKSENIVLVTDIVIAILALFATILHLLRRSRMIKITTTLHQPRKIRRESFESLYFSAITCLMAFYEMVERGHKLVVETSGDRVVTINALRPSGTIGKTISFVGRPVLISMLRRQIVAYRNSSEFDALEARAIAA
jgi:hypothetical protein